MGFLDKLNLGGKETTTEAVAATVAIPTKESLLEKMRKSRLEREMAEAKQKETESAQAAPAAVNPLLAALARKKAEDEAKKKETESKVEEAAKEETIKEETTQNTDKENAKEVKPETEVEVKINNIVAEKTDTKTETVEEKAASIKADPEVVKEEPKKRRRRRTTKKAESDESTTEKTALVSGKDNKVYTTEYTNLDIFGMKMSFEEAATGLMSNYIDQDFIDFRDNIYEKLNAVKIDKDANSAVLKYALEELNNINDEIALPLAEAEALVMALSDKECGVGTVTKALASAEDEGGNANTRAAAGYRALMNASVNGQTINLLTMLIAAKVRLNYLTSIRNRIEFKRNSLITLNGALKLEADLTH